MSLSPTAPRRSAVALLDEVLGKDRLLSDLIASGALDKLPPEDRARAQRLATETLRGLERADRLLKAHLRKEPPLSIRNLLRVGTVELCQGEAAHGVVHSCVEIAASHKKYGALKGLVNAVLRKLAADGPEKWAALRAPRLPGWLRKPLVAAWGPEAMGRIEAAHLAGAPLDLTPHPGFPDLCAELNAERLPTGTLRLTGSPQVSALVGYEAGAWWVQDAAAAIAAQVLDAQAGETVLDLCAAPGGKTLQLAAAGADVTAIDISEDRLDVLRENLTRTGMTATVMAADALELSGQYDAILLDAPCSATGTIRRHPDLPHVRDGSGIAELITLQAQMLDHAWTLLKPGGRLVYCTCSLIPDEGEVQIIEALPRHSDMELDLAALERPGIDPDWIDPEAGLRLRPDYWPERGGMDGFFVGALRKAA